MSDGLYSSIAEDIQSGVPSTSLTSFGVGGGGYEPGYTSPGSGGWFSGLKDWFGSSPTKTTEGTGALGFLSDVGGVAKTLLPIAGIGTGIMGVINQLQAQKQAGQAQKDAQAAQKVQLTGAQGAQALAPEIASVARQNQPLAALASSVAPKIDAAATNVRTGIVSPVQTFATDALRRAQAGEIPPAIEAQIQQWGQQAKQRMLAYLASSGQDNSQARAQFESEIEAQMQGMRAQYLQSEETQALGAFEQASKGETTAGALFGQEAAAGATSAEILNAETGGLGRSADALTGASQAAGGAAQQQRQEQQMLLKLIADTNAALARLTASAS